MSLRTLFEVNHDYAVRDQADLLHTLQLYLNSASREHAEALERYGIRVLGMRHHSGNFIIEGEPDGFPVQHMTPAAQRDGVGRAPRPMLNASQVPGTPSNPAFEPEVPLDDHQLPDASGGR